MVRGGSSKSASSTSTYHYKEPFYEKPIYHFILILLIISSLIIGIVALVNTFELKSPSTDTISVSDFLSKLTSHAEMAALVGIIPLNIVEINNDNIANLRIQISGLDNSFIGDFIVQYQDRIVVYDYDDDEIKANLNLQQQQLQQEQLPADFFTKLNVHPELQGLENEQPIGGQIDQATLSTLQQQFPDVYANAKVGDFLLRYTTKLVIYDYNQDAVVNAVDLG